MSCACEQKYRLDGNRQTKQDRKVGALAKSNTFASLRSGISGARQVAEQDRHLAN